MSISFQAVGKKIILDLRKVDNVRALKCWLAYNDMNITVLAKRLEVHPSTVSRVITGERASRVTVEKLIALGLPSELFE
jgi:predicted transcriptional regulator